MGSVKNKLEETNRLCLRIAGKIIRIDNQSIFPETRFYFAIQPKTASYKGLIFKSNLLL